MGRRKEEIIQNIKQKLKFKNPVKPLIPITNIKIKHTLDVNTNIKPNVKIKLREERKNMMLTSEEFNSTSSNDLYNTNESKKFKKIKERCPHLQSNK